MEKSYHAYCMGYQGVWRVKIPSDKPDQLELKIEPVFTCDLDLLPTDMELSSCGHNVYMAGGKDNRSLLYVFDPTSFKEEEFPVKNPQFLYQPMLLPFDKSQPLVSPISIQCNRQIYFITQYVNPWFGKSVENICFQSFNPTTKSFHILPSPPYTPGTTRATTDDGLEVPLPLGTIRTRTTTGACLQLSFAGDGDTTFRVAAHFAVFNHIYFFIQERLRYDRQNNFLFMRAFSFDANKSEWEERELMVQEFKEKKIPIPFLHKGDTGVSPPVAGSGAANRFLVALCNTTPTAYYVTLSKDGTLRPISCRYLEEIKSEKSTAMTQLHDMGSGRFCVIYESFHIPLMVYVFKIDYAIELGIQTGQLPSTTASSKILCSRKFLHDNLSVGYPVFYAYCLASDPASQSSGNQIDAAEEQEIVFVNRSLPGTSQSSGNQIDASEEQDIGLGNTSFPVTSQSYGNQIDAAEEQDVVLVNRSAPVTKRRTRVTKRKWEGLPRKGGAQRRRSSPC